MCGGVNTRSANGVPMQGGGPGARRRYLPAGVVGQRAAVLRTSDEGRSLACGCQTWTVSSAYLPEWSCLYTEGCPLCLN